MTAENPTLERLQAEHKNCPECLGAGGKHITDEQGRERMTTCLCLVRMRVCQIVGPKVFDAAISTREPPHLRRALSYCIRSADWRRDICPRIKQAALNALYANRNASIPAFKYITDLDIKRSSLRGKEDIGQEVQPPNIDSLMNGQGLLVVRLGFCGVAPPSLGDHVADALAIRGDRPMWVVDSPTKKTTPLLEERLSEMELIEFKAPEPPNEGL